MQFRILGPMEIESDDGHVHTLTRRQERALLAILLLNPGQLMPVDRLRNLLWDDPPDQARTAIHVHVSRVRGALARAGSPELSTALVSRRGGYLLDVDPDTVDAHRFRRLLGAAKQAADLTARDALLRDALSLWRGRALANAAATDRLRQRLCADLDELYLHANEEALATGLALGRHREILSDLARQCAEHPARQRLIELHMLALHRDGRIADALDVYRRARQHLADTAGIDPTPALQELHQAILRGNPLPGPAEDTTAPKTAYAPAQLPPDISAFAGRARALADLDALLPTDSERSTAPGVAVVVITGTAGIGKTALAVHWAHRVRGWFPDGQLYINLRGFDPTGNMVSPVEGIRRFLDALDVPSHRIPSDLDAGTALYRSLLADRKMLVLLDNARDAEQVRPLLPSGARCLALVTSRSALAGLVATEGAHPVRLDLLTDAEAGELLARRLGHGRIAAEPEAVAELVARCVRLPLALTIVAARAAGHRQFSLAMLAGELRNAADRLEAFVLDDPYTDIHAVFSWSYRTLSPAAASLFRLLGLQPGPDITVPAAASLIGRPVAAVRPLLAELARANLVTEYAAGRYTFHDLLRAYAAHLAHTIDTDPQRHAAIHRFLDHYLHSAHAADRLLEPTRDPIALTPAQPGASPIQPADYQQALDWFGAERSVLLAAIDHAASTDFDTHAWQLPFTLTTFLARRGHWRDLAAAGRTAVAATRRLADPGAEARAHRVVARACTLLGRLDEADTHLRHAIDLYQQFGDRIGQAHAHSSLAHLWERRGRPAVALEHARQALRLYEDAGHRVGHAGALNSIGWLHALLGDYGHAVIACQQALTMHQELGDRDYEAEAWDSLGYAHRNLGHHTKALACYDRALKLRQELGDRYEEATTLTNLGDAHQAAGNEAAACDAWQRALDILSELDHADAGTVATKLNRLKDSMLDGAGG